MDAPRRIVLIVEDERLVRMTLRHYLERLGCEVFEAKNGAEALQLGRSAPRLDLLITDLRLPDRSGRTVADDLRRDRPGLAVLFMSGLADLEPDLDVLQKPFDEQQLAARIQALPGA